MAWRLTCGTQTLRIITAIESLAAVWLHVNLDIVRNEALSKETIWVNNSTAHNREM